MLRVMPSRRTGTSLKTGKDEGLGFAAWLDHSDAKPEGSVRPALARRQRYIRLNISVAALRRATKQFRRHCEIGLCPAKSRSLPPFWLLSSAVTAP
jgi:hypothetical protein